MSSLFIEYPKCTTCQKAKKWLDEQGVSYEGYVPQKGNLKLCKGFYLLIRLAA